MTLLVDGVSMPAPELRIALDSTVMRSTLLDEAPEADNGYVELVNAKEAPDGTITETTERTGLWAWKHAVSNGRSHLACNWI